MSKTRAWMSVPDGVEIQSVAALGATTTAMTTSATARRRAATGHRLMASRPRCTERPYTARRYALQPGPAGWGDPSRRHMRSQIEPEYANRVLGNFVDAGGRLISIPAQHKKLLVVLRWLVEDFQPGRRYPESEINRIIGRRHPDFATLRRLLGDEELMQRRRGVYWRTGSVPNVGFDPDS